MNLSLEGSGRTDDLIPHSSALELLEPSTPQNPADSSTRHEVSPSFSSLFDLEKEFEKPSPTFHESELLYGGLAPDPERADALVEKFSDLKAWTDENL